MDSSEDSAAARFSRLSTRVLLVGILAMLVAIFCFTIKIDTRANPHHLFLIIFRSAMIIPPFFFLHRLIQRFSTSRPAIKSIFVMLSLLVVTNLITFLKTLFDPHHGYTYDKLFGFTRGEEYILSWTVFYWMATLIILAVAALIRHNTKKETSVY